MTIYKIYNARHDIPEQLYLEFRAATDDDAITTFEEVRKRSHLAWDRLRMTAEDTKRKSRQIVYHEPE